MLYLYVKTPKILIDIRQKGKKYMPRRCLTCSHSKIGEINSLLHNNQPYSTIAKKFNLEPTNVRNHMVNHIKPIIDRANAKAEQVVVDKILTYRKEVNYGNYILYTPKPVLTKCFIAMV